MSVVSGCEVKEYNACLITHLKRDLDVVGEEGEPEPPPTSPGGNPLAHSAASDRLLGRCVHGGVP